MLFLGISCTSLSLYPSAGASAAGSSSAALAKKDQSGDSQAMRCPNDVLKYLASEGKQHSSIKEAYDYGFISASTAQEASNIEIEMDKKAKHAQFLVHNLYYIAAAKHFKAEKERIEKETALKENAELKEKLAAILAALKEVQASATQAPSGPQQNVQQPAAKK